MVTLEKCSEKKCVINYTVTGSIRVQSRVPDAEEDLA